MVIRMRSSMLWFRGLTLLVLFLSCKHGKDHVTVTVTLEKVLTASCLPTLPIPGRPPFDIIVESATASTVRVRLQQLPDAYPPPSFEVERTADFVRLVALPDAILAGSTFCDVVVRIDGLTPGTYTLGVERRHPELSTLKLGTKSLVVPD